MKKNELCALVGTLIIKSLLTEISKFLNSFLSTVCTYNTTYCLAFHLMMFSVTKGTKRRIKKDFQRLTTVGIPSNQGTFDNIFGICKQQQQQQQKPQHNTISTDLHHQYLE